MMRAVGSASPMMRLVATTAAFASVYFVVAVLPRSVIGDSGLAVLWPASGLYLGVLLVAPHRLWAALACGAWVGSLAAYLHTGSSLEVSVAFAVPSAAEGLLGALLVERIAGGRFRLRGLRDVFALVLGGAVVANALVGLSAGVVAAQTFGVSFGESWLRWWSADALGVIAVTPIITAPPRPRGLRAAALVGLVVALVAAHLADGHVYTVQLFLAVLLLSWLVLAVLLAERERALGEGRRASAESEAITEKLDEAGRHIAGLTAELAARTAELNDARRRRERVAEDFRDSQATNGQLERELRNASRALAEAEERISGLSRHLAEAAAERDRVRRELDASALAVGRLQAELGDAAGELANARAEQARTGEHLAEANSARRRAQDDLERLGARFEKLRGELERMQRAHREASQALVQERTHFAAQRERLERSLEEATRRLANAEAERRRLAYRATELSSRYDHRGTCLDASPGFCRLLGYEREELVGRPGAELLHVEDRPQLARARATRSNSIFHARLRRKAGDFVWVEVSLQPVWDSAAQRLVELKTTVRDVSEKRTATQAAA